MIWFDRHAYNLATKREVSNSANFGPARARGAVRNGVLMAYEREGFLTLGIDTATEKRSVAVFRGAQKCSVCVSDSSDGGSANVLGDIERALKESFVKAEEIELFAAASGPGSFTGLRAGLATLKGLAATLGKPVIGVQTLHAVAHVARPAERLVALIPAGRGEVFAQLLGVSLEGEVVEREAPSHIPPARLVERVARLGGGVKWAGGGAHKFIELIQGGAAASGIKFVAAACANELAPDGVWVVAPPVEALAPSVVMLARQKFLRGEALSAESLRAIYVRPSDAELKG